MKRIPALIGLVIGSLGVLNVAPAHAAVVCTSSITGQTINDSVVVPPNETCSISDSTIAGNISVGAGGVLFMSGATTVGGSVSTDGGNILPGCNGTHIVGNLSLSRHPTASTQSSCTTGMRIDG